MLNHCMVDFLHQSKIKEKMARKIADKVPSLMKMMVDNDKAYFEIISALRRVNEARKTQGKFIYAIENPEASREAPKS